MKQGANLDRQPSSSGWSYLYNGMPCTDYVEVQPDPTGIPTIHTLTKTACSVSSEPPQEEELVSLLVVLELTKERFVVIRKPSMSFTPLMTLTDVEEESNRRAITNVGWHIDDITSRITYILNFALLRLTRCRIRT